jgi:hypothetical protein
MLRAGGGGGGVASFNSRTGAVTQTSGDVTTALGFTPLNPANNLNDVNSQATALANLGGVSVLRSYIAGLTLSNDGGTPSSVLDIAAGQAADSGNAVMISIGAFPKSTAGAWTSGTGNNGMGNGLTIANSTWYHVILANNGGTRSISTLRPLGQIVRLESATRRYAASARSLPTAARTSSRSNRSGRHFTGRRSRAMWRA